MLTKTTNKYVMLNLNEINANLEYNIHDTLKKRICPEESSASNEDYAKIGI